MHVIDKHGSDTMITDFIQRHAAFVTGVLSGFDRVRFRGTLRRIANCKGLVAGNAGRFGW